MTGGRFLHSPWLGEIEWFSAAELLFPAGLPGFESERRILPVEIPAQRPLIYLQSLECHDVCFVTLPVLAIDPSFELRLSRDDILALGLSPCKFPVLGEDALCLALLVPAEGTVQVNLNAPVVINLRRGVGAQCNQTGDLVKGRFLLKEQGWEAMC